MLNTPEARLDEVCAIIGSRVAERRCRSPSRGWSRVHALVPSAEVWRLLPELEAGGRLLDPRRPRRADGSVSIVAEIKRRRRRGRARAGRSSSTASSRLARSPSRSSLPREALLALADRVRRWHEAQRPADISLEVEPGVLLERRWVPLEHRRDLRPAQPRLDARDVRRAGAGRGRASGSSSARRPRAPAWSPRPRELLGIDEVWALGGPQAIGWLAYVRKVDKIVGPGQLRT